MTRTKVGKPINTQTLDSIWEYINDFSPNSDERFEEAILMVDDSIQPFWREERESARRLHKELSTPPGLISLADLATAVDLSPERVRQLARAGNLGPTIQGEHKSDPIYVNAITALEYFAKKHRRIHTKPRKQA